MDPNQALKDLLTGCHDVDRKRVTEALHTLTEWVERGGFLPDAVTCAEAALVEALKILDAEGDEMSQEDDDGRFDCVACGATMLRGSQSSLCAACLTMTG